MKLMNILEKHWFKITVAISIFFLIGSLIMFIAYGSTNAQTFKDNIYVEFFIGGLMLMIPIIIGATIGKKIAKGLFYHDIEIVIRQIKEERVKGTINEFGARSMVMVTSKTFGKDILEDPLKIRLPRKADPISYEDKKCGVCNLKAELAINNHCANCRLNCFAWEDLKNK